MNITFTNTFCTDLVQVCTDIRAVYVCAKMWVEWVYNPHFGLFFKSSNRETFGENKFQDKNRILHSTLTYSVRLFERHSFRSSNAWSLYFCLSFSITLSLSLSVSYCQSLAFLLTSFTLIRIFLVPYINIIIYILLVVQSRVIFVVHYCEKSTMHNYRTRKKQQICTDTYMYLNEKKSERRVHKNFSFTAIRWEM